VRIWVLYAQVHNVQYWRKSQYSEYSCDWSKKVAFSSLNTNYNSLCGLKFLALLSFRKWLLHYFTLKNPNK